MPVALQTQSLLPTTSHERSVAGTSAAGSGHGGTAMVAGPQPVGGVTPQSMVPSVNQMVGPGPKVPLPLQPMPVAAPTTGVIGTNQSLMTVHGPPQAGSPAYSTTTRPSVT